MMAESVGIAVAEDPFLGWIETRAGRIPPYEIRYCEKLIARGGAGFEEVID